MLGLLFESENGDDMYLRRVGISPALKPRILSRLLVECDYRRGFDWYLDLLDTYKS
jgi:hypothetical protein